MNDYLYYALCGVCVGAVLLGINMMSKVKSSVKGNGLSAIAMVFAIALIFFLNVKAAGIPVIVAILLSLAVGTVIGIHIASKAKMITMPQLIALLNGLGGGASALVAAVTAVDGGVPPFEAATAGLALAIGALTLTGSLIAAGKLARILDARPKSLPCHSLIMGVLAVLTVAGIVLQTISSGAWAILVSVLSLALGVVFVMRVGGADMPITISLLNALSGVAGGIAGMAINEPLLVAVGGIVGASGLILTQDMCKAMNRKLVAILTGKTTATAPVAKVEKKEAAPAKPAKLTEAAVGSTLQNAKKVIIVPGYGMALSQAQADVAALASVLERKGVEVKFAIHPVAGRMPGHMSVLLCEADIDYEKLYMMEDINDDFASCDLVVVIGANDVTNPAANTAEGTPIYGMPVLDVEKAPMTVFCNFDTKPGYAGVPNPLYEADNVLLMLGDAKESVQKLLGYAEGTKAAAPQVEAAPESGKLTVDAVGGTLQSAKKVIIVPGYGMALSQAQADVARLASVLERRGAEVKFAIHPVAGRMPGHMSVLLCEADIDYEKLYMMEDINDDFSSCDLVVVIGANDVTNPAANTAEGTPIYGMPVLDVEKAPMTVFCNFDTKPGYAGVPNPLYEADNVLLMLGDAKESVQKLIAYAEGTKVAAPQAEAAQEAAKLSLDGVGATLQNAKKVIIVPGYGMALSQAQADVARLASSLERRGVEVKFAIHPVAGRMPGHMSVLLCEADIDYEKLYMMEDINGEFASCDLAVVIGANDVTNPAANTAEGTPIYGMPVLNVEDAPKAVFCNFDTKPGYAGVPNPLYDADNVLLLLGDAKESVSKLQSYLA